MKTLLFIARKDGGENFLSHKNWETFTELAQQNGNLIVDSNTYKAVKNWAEDHSFDDLIGIEKIIISQHSSYQLDEGYTLAQSPQNAIAQLRQKGFETILVTGDSTTNISFIKENLLDEILLNIEPAVLENVLSWFSPVNPGSRLKLLGMESLGDDIVQFHYKVEKS